MLCLPPHHHHPFVLKLIFNARRTSPPISPTCRFLITLADPSYPSPPPTPNSTVQIVVAWPAIQRMNYPPPPILLSHSYETFSMHYKTKNVSGETSHTPIRVYTQIFSLYSCSHSFGISPHLFSLSSSVRTS
jgi:hypothetical protein